MSLPIRSLRWLERGLGAIFITLGLLLVILVVFPLVTSGGGGLEVAKLAPELVEAGEVIQYTITVTNDLGQPISDVLLVDIVPMHTSYVSGSMRAKPGVLTPTAPLSITAGSTMTWTIGSITDAESITMSFQVTVASPLVSGTQILNTAAVSDVSAVATTTVHATPDLTVTKAVMPDLVKPGGVVTYTIWITNQGNGIADNTTVVDNLPDGFYPSEKTWMWLDVVDVLSLTVTATAAVSEGTYYNWVTVTHGISTVAAGPTAPTSVRLPRVYLPFVLKYYPLPPTWHQGEGTAGLTVFNVAGCATDCTVLYAATQENGVYVSQDGGQSWAATDLSEGRVHWVVVHPDRCDEAYAATWGTGVQKTVDGGRSWTEVNNGLEDLFLYALSIAPDGQTLYAGTASAGVYKSMDAGDSWSAANNGLPAGVLVDAIVIDPGEPKYIYAGTWGLGVFKSSTGGAAWSEANDGLADAEIYALAVDPSDANVLYVATHTQGVYRSDDRTGNWSEDGLPGRVAYTVAVDERGLAFAGTDGSKDGLGVYQRLADGVWEALGEQPGARPNVRNLSFCEDIVLSGTSEGVWWYGSDN